MSTMTVSSTSGYNPTLSLQAAQQTTSSPVADSDGDHDGSSGSRGGFLISALQSSFASIGVGNTNSSGSNSSASASSDSSTATDPQQALQSFLQTLFAALQSGGTAAPGQTGSTSTGDSGSAAVATAGAASTAGAPTQGHHHHHGGAGRLEAGVQNLLQELSASTSGSTISGSTLSDSTTDTTGDSSGSNSALSSLQSSFNNLLAATGTTAPGATLTSFLQSLSQNLQGAGSTGGVVSTHV